MYFWKIKKLREQLILNGLSQRALFVYVFIYVLLCEGCLEFSLLFAAEAETGSADWIWASINTLVIAIGTWLCYYFNGGNRGREFAERYFSISFVVAVRVLALAIPAMIFYLENFRDEAATAGIVEQVVVILWTAAYYWRVCTHIKVVARERKS
jgi:O-antigen ligase